jgi:uncharacterized protein YpuA (DUF1002 family)
VTLGADLSEDQKTAILKYFGILGENIETLTITNQDERDHLGSYVPIEQIGTRTFSCALVCPTESGGIHVKTANLSWVTSNMIATTLSTSGVVNCDVLAASPFEVSGTGALTGIIMAYETASGQTLDPVKKELATQELITTGSLANDIGQQQATSIVNEIKIQVIQGQVVEPEEVEEIVDEIVDQKVEYTLSDEDRALLTGLMTQIAEQEYDYDEMKETLERVDENLQNIYDILDADPTPEIDEIADDSEEEEQEVLPADSILYQTDDSALGSDVIIDSTNQETVETEPAQETETTETSDFGFEIISSDTYTDETSVDETEQPVQESEIYVPEETQAPTESYIPEETEAPTESYIPEETEAPTESYVPEETQAPTESYVPEETEAPTESYVPEETEAPTESYVPEETEALTESYVPEETEEPVLPLEITSSYVSDTAFAGSGLIKILLENDDLIPLEGTLSLWDENGTLVSQVDLQDSKKLSVLAASEEDKRNLGGNSGTELLVNFDWELQPYTSYRITLDNASFAQTEDPSWLEGAPVSEPISTSWDIMNTKEFGVSLDLPDFDELSAGTEISGTVHLPGLYGEEEIESDTGDDGMEAADGEEEYTDESGEPAVYAVISDYDGNLIAFSRDYFTPGETDFVITCFASGTAHFTVEYFDSDGMLSGSASYEFVIQ